MGAFTSERRLKFQIRTQLLTLQYVLKATGKMKQLIIVNYILTGLSGVWDQIHTSVCTQFYTELGYNANQVLFSLTSY